MVRLVLFDIDGTLLSTGGAGMKAFTKVLATEFDAADGYQWNFAGRTDGLIVRECFEYYRIPATPENFDRFYHRYVFWLDHFLGEGRTEIYPGVREFLAGLERLSPPPLLALLTGNIRLGAELKLRRAGLWERFVTGGFADDHESRDQIAAIARQRGSRLLQGPLRDDEVVVIGDTPFDIRCGRAIHAKVLAVATGGASFAELEKHQPDWIVSDLTRITAEEVAR